MYFAGAVDEIARRRSRRSGYVFVARHFGVFVVIAVMSGMPHACPGAALPSSNADIDPATANALSHASSIAARLPPESVFESSRSGSIWRPQMPPGRVDVGRRGARRLVGRLEQPGLHTADVGERRDRDLLRRDAGVGRPSSRRRTPRRTTAGPLPSAGPSSGPSCRRSARTVRTAPSSSGGPALATGPPPRSGPVSEPVCCVVPPRR